jgi:hypothetical protein
VIDFTALTKLANEHAIKETRVAALLAEQERERDARRKEIASRSTSEWMFRATEAYTERDALTFALLAIASAIQERQ